jgi:hypothetical protein
LTDPRSPRATLKEQHMPEKKTGATDALLPVLVPVPGPPARYPGSTSSHLEAHTGPAPADLELFAGWPSLARETGETPDDRDTLGDGDENRAARPQIFRLAALACAVALVTATGIVLLTDDTSSSRMDSASAPMANEGRPIPTFPFLISPAELGNSRDPGPTPRAKDTSDAGGDTKGTGSPTPEKHGTTPKPRPRPTTGSPAQPPADPPSADPPSADPPSPSQGISIQSVHSPNRYWHLRDAALHLDPVGSGSSTQTKQEASFELVPGLADPRCVSFATSGDRYLRHYSFLLRADTDDGSTLFEQDATFCPSQSVFGDSIMLESINYPGRYIRGQQNGDFRLSLDPYSDTDDYLLDTAFRVVEGCA